MEAAKTFNILINTSPITSYWEFVGLHGPNFDMVVSVAGAWTTAELHVQVSEDGVTWQNLKTAANAFVGVAAFAAGVAFRIADIPRHRFMRLASQDNAGAAVNQAAARVLTVLIESYP